MYPLLRRTEAPCLSYRKPRLILHRSLSRRRLFLVQKSGRGHLCLKAIFLGSYRAGFFATSTPTKWQDRKNPWMLLALMEIQWLLEKMAGRLIIPPRHKPDQQAKPHLKTIPFQPLNHVELPLNKELSASRGRIKETHGLSRL
jgi:hypothetical protein